MSTACAIRLQSVLERAIAWRRRELVAAYLGIPSDEWPSRVYCRQAVLLLYAHVEGFVKYAAAQYLQAIHDSGVASIELCAELLGLALNVNVNRAVNQASMSIMGAVLHQVVDDPRSLPAIPTKNIVKTHANLSSRRLRKILSTIGLDSTRYGDMEVDVINRLLKWRNAIAHGEGVPIDQEDYRSMHHRVLDFLDDLKTYFEESAANGAYLRK